MEFDKKAAQNFFLERATIAFGKERVKMKILMQSRRSQNQFSNHVRYKEVNMQKLQESTVEISAAVKTFYNALQDIFQGSTASMEKVWSHADDVTYLGPQGGIIVGWHQVFQAWKKQAHLKLQGKIELQDIHVIREGDIGIVQCYEIGSNILNGKAEPVRIRALNIFRKENGAWKMISHQTDLLPFLE